MIVTLYSCLPGNDLVERVSLMNHSGFLVHGLASVETPGAGATTTQRKYLP